MTSEWEREAERWGIERSYWDVRGIGQNATPLAIQSIAAALSAFGRSPEPAPQPCAPEPAYQGDGRRGWLVTVQLYSLRSRRNWGLGDFTDLAALIQVAADLGAAGIGLNPLHAQFSERPDDASPYAPNSRLLLNPLYIDVEAIPHFPHAYVRDIADRLNRLRDAELIDYRSVAELKWAALRLAHRSFSEHASAAERADFAHFCAERSPALLRFAAFETLRQKFKKVWWEWPPEWRGPNDVSLRRLQDEDAGEVEFHQFVQWVADRQLQTCSALTKALGMPIGLYVDLAVGVDTSGADAWIAQDAMLRGLSVGAPPDDYNTAGQDWGLTAYDPHGLVRQNFAPLRDMLQAIMRHAGAIRIDHALGLMRLFVIPHGSKPGDGAYLRFPFDAMLNVIAEESRRCRCIVIGEDLGTVPEGFRDTMHAWGLWSYLVVLFEREGDGSFTPPQCYRENAMATFGTHDLPTFAGWITGHDLTIKRAIGVDPGESDENRARSQTALRRAIGEPGTYLQMLKFLAATPSRLVSIAIEDVLRLRDQVNVPGTVREHPNWRRRLPVDVEALRDDQQLREVAAVLQHSGRGCG
jgi:4-alpha-glucanotransferase